MDSCGCKICKNNLQAVVNEQATAGASPKEIASFLLQEAGAKYTEKLIERHLKAFEIEPTKLSKTTVEPLPIKRETGVAQAIAQLNKLDFSSFEFDPNNPEDVLQYLQKVHLALHLKTSAALNQHLGDYLEGHVLDLDKDLYTMMKTSLECLRLVAPFDVVASEKAAIARLEALGYKISPGNVVNVGSSDG